MKLELSRQISENYLKYQNFMKIHPMGVELFQADGQTDGQEEVNSHPSQFCVNQEDYTL